MMRFYKLCKSRSKSVGMKLETVSNNVEKICPQSDIVFSGLIKMSMKDYFAYLFVQF